MSRILLCLMMIAINSPILANSFRGRRGRSLSVEEVRSCDDVRSLCMRNDCSYVLSCVERCDVDRDLACVMKCAGAAVSKEGQQALKEYQDCAKRVTSRVREPRFRSPFNPPTTSTTLPSKPITDYPLPNDNIIQTIQPPSTRDLKTCTLCREVWSRIDEKKLGSNTMRIREIFGTFCSENNVEECHDLFRNYDFMMELYVRKRLNPEKVCDQAGLCGATGAAGLFVSAERFEETKKQTGKNNLLY